MTTKQSHLQTLATSNPDWPTFASTLPPTFLKTESPIPQQLTEDVAALLRTENPELVIYLDNPPPYMQSLNIIPTMLTVGALLFLLRTHISFERTANGKWSFRIEHTGMSDELVKKIIEDLKEWLPNSK